jgi:hypothetical protein
MPYRRTDNVIRKQAARHRTIIEAALLIAAPVRAQDREAVRTTFQEPVYPEDLNKEGKQGNVVLIGRIDTQGHIQELRAIAASMSSSMPLMASNIRLVNSSALFVAITHEVGRSSATTVQRRSAMTRWRFRRSMRC